MMSINKTQFKVYATAWSVLNCDYIKISSVEDCSASLLGQQEKSRLHWRFFASKRTFRFLGCFLWCCPYTTSEIRRRTNNTRMRFKGPGLSMNSTKAHLVASSKRGDR